MPLRPTDAHLRDHQEQGYAAPIPILTPAAVARHRAALEAYEDIKGQTLAFPEKSKCHLLFGWADVLVHHPAVEDVIGPDILLFHATLQTREAHRATMRSGTRTMPMSTSSRPSR